MKPLISVSRSVLHLRKKRDPTRQYQPGGVIYGQEDG